MTRFVISGSSHALTLQAGMRLLAEASPELYPDGAEPNSWDIGEDALSIFTLGGGRFELEAFSSISRGKAQLTGTAAQAMRRTMGSAVFDSSTVWAFANICNTRRTYVKPMWRTCAPSALGPIGDRTPLTEAVIRQILVAEHAPIRALYAQLAQAGVPVIAVETPRLRRDAKFFGDKDERRVGLWVDNLHRAMWHEYLASLSIPYVEAPQATIDPDGFLLPELRRVGVTKSGLVDRHHASSEWGALYLPRILDALVVAARA